MSDLLPSLLSAPYWGAVTLTLKLATVTTVVLLLLGTPLATIALVAKELKRELPAQGPHTEDIDLLISQTARCREILARLSSREAQTDEMTVMVELLDPQRDGAAAKADIERRLKEVTGVRLTVTTHGKGALDGHTGTSQTSKLKRLLDKRK